MSVAANKEPVREIGARPEAVALSGMESAIFRMLEQVLQQTTELCVALLKDNADPVRWQFAHEALRGAGQIIKAMERFAQSRTAMGD